MRPCVRPAQKTGGEGVGANDGEGGRMVRGGQQLMAIASDERLTNRSHASDMPSSWDTSGADGSVATPHNVHTRPWAGGRAQAGCLAQGGVRKVQCSFPVCWSAQAAGAVPSVAIPVYLLRRAVESLNR